MGFERAQPVASHKPMAIRSATMKRVPVTLSSGKVIPLHHADSEALLLGRKGGRDIISIGTFSIYPTNIPLLAGDSITQVMQKADEGRALDWRARWDGETLLLEPRFKPSPVQRELLVDVLDSVLKDPTHLPLGWDGWFQKRKRR